MIRGRECKSRGHKYRTRAITFAVYVEELSDDGETSPDIRAIVVPLELPDP